MGSCRPVVERSVEVSLSDLTGGPSRLICQPYGERVTELSREP